MCLVGVFVRRYIDFLLLLIPTPLVSVLFCRGIPTFGSLKKKFFVLVRMPFRSCSSAFFVIKFYVLNKFFSQYKPTYGLLRAPHGSHMKGCT